MINEISVSVEDVERTTKPPFVSSIWQFTSHGQQRSLVLVQTNGDTVRLIHVRSGELRHLFLSIRSEQNNLVIRAHEQALTRTHAWPADRRESMKISSGGWDSLEKASTMWPKPYQSARFDGEKFGTFTAVRANDRKLEHRVTRLRLP